MITRYLDASAVLRLLLREPGEAVPLARGIIAVSSQLLEVETSRALDRARLTLLLDDWQAATKHKELSDLLSRIHLVPIASDVIALARASFPVCVRALDAVHVASAQVLSAQVGALEFWTHDKRQAAAAMSRGLEVRGIQ